MNTTTTTTTTTTMTTPRDPDHELYETETMAELCARQGRLQEAVAIYRRLLDTHAGSGRHEREGRWGVRLAELEQAWGHAAGEEIEPEPIPLPRSPGVAVAATDDSVTVAWSLNGAQASTEPVLELFLIQKTPSGVETSKRALALPASTGRVAFAVPALHSALAAVGRRQGDRFIPVARSRV